MISQKNMENRAYRLEDFKVVPRTIPIVRTPTFPIGDFGRAFYDLMKKDAETNFPENKYIFPLQIDEQTGEVSQSNLFTVARTQQIIPASLGITPVSLAGSADLEILHMTEGRHYLDIPATVLRSTKDRVNSKNEPLAKYLAEHIEGFSSDKPAFVRGFGVEAWPEDENGYQLKLVPLNGESLDILLDERFSFKYNGWKFTKVDEKGIPTDLTDPENFKGKNGRTWHTRSDGLSRVFVYLNDDVYSDGDHLALSYEYGRVAFVSAEGARAQNFSVSDLIKEAQRKELVSKLQSTREYLSNLERQIASESP